MIGTAMASTELSPAEASTKEMIVKTIIHARYEMTGSRRWKNSEVAAIKPTAVVMQAVSTMRPKTICPGQPIVIWAASASSVAPSL